MITAAERPEALCAMQFYAQSYAQLMVQQPHKSRLSSSFARLHDCDKKSKYLIENRIFIFGVKPI